MFSEGQTLDNSLSQNLKARDSQDVRERYRLNLPNEKEEGFSNTNQQSRKFSTKIPQDKHEEVSRVNKDLKKAG
jgi:hypothetical protein